MRLLAALLSLTAVAFAQAPSFTPGASDRLLLKGHVVRPSGPIAGEVLVVGNTIKCAAVSCSGAAGATIIDTQGIIFPGLIDAHNHAAFNMFDEADWNPGPIYRNHNQWPRNDRRYPQVMAAKKHLESSAGADLGCEMDKYGEIKALIAATTSVLLAPKLTVKACFGSLARTIDTPYNDIDGRDTIQTSISVPDERGGVGVCNAIDAGTTKAYIVHVGEGVDETSRKEFDTLANRARGCLLRKETTIIHGTAFGYLEFRKMALNDMALVWSPKSNMFLYKRADGQPATTRIDLALQAGVKRIALGPDWALGGSMNLLDELRFAKKIATENHWTAVSDERLFRMVTIDAAKALGVADKLGSISPGKRADLVVIAGNGSQPFTALLKATPETVRLVMVDGRILYGDKDLHAALPSTPPCDALDVCGSPKFLCVAEASVANKFNQTLPQIDGALRSALRSYDKAHPDIAPTLSPIAPLFSCPPA